MEQILYKLPDGWEWSNLTDICTPSRKTVEPNPEEQYNYIGLENIESHTGKVISDSPTKGSEISSTKVSFKKGMVLYGKLRPYLNKVVVAKIDGIATTEIIPFECSDAISPDFLAYYLRSQYFVDLAMNNCSGARMPRATTKLFTQIAKVPVTSITEQKRIVEKLDALLTRIDTAIEYLQESVTLADAMFSSALNRVFNPSGSKGNFDSGYSLPEGWDWRTVNDLSTKIQYGHTAKAADKGNAQFLRITDIQDNNIDWLGVPFVDLMEKEIEKYALKNNDLVFARSGATAGKSILIKEPPKNAIFASYLIRIVPDTEIIQPEYLELFFKSPAYWDIVKANAAGAAQPNINGTKLGEFKVPTPSMEIQKRIVDEMSSLSARVTELKKELRDKVYFIESAKSSILNSAFKGEL